MKSEFATKRQTLSVTGNTTLTRADLGKLIHNTSATGAAEVDLPTNQNPDDTINFFVGAAQNLVIDPGAAGIFIKTGGATAAGTKLTSNTVGSWLRLTCVAANKWAVELGGTWA